MGLRLFRTIGAMFGNISGVDKEERYKVLFLSLSFFFIIGAYTLAKDLKDTVFASTVGGEYVPWVRIIALVALVPAILLYGALVDRTRRYQLVMYYSLFFGIVGLACAYLLGHPVIGLHNTHQSVYRYFGWFFYIFVEGYSPFMVSVFWAFANSISSPDGAKQSYGLIVSASKVSGMLSAGIAWMLFTWSTPGEHALVIGHVASHQLMLAISSALLLMVPLMIHLLMKKVPEQLLHGYEAVYRVERAKMEAGKEKSAMFAGLKMLLKYPYVMGIFGMVFFYEVVATVFSYLRVNVAQQNAISSSDMSGFFFKISFFIHVVGFFFSMFATRALLQQWGERICLLLIPVLSGLVMLCFMFVGTPNALVFSFVALKAINYAFSWPVRESLYIPAVKEIKFKSKAWIDAFGSKFAKASGAGFTIMISLVGQAMVFPIFSFFFAAIVGTWFMVAFLLGLRFERAVERGEAIGSEEFDKA